MKFNPLDHPVCLDMPLWLEETAWAGHLPFAMFLISAARPRTYVELGVDRGTSYCCFCQAVKSEKSGTRCFAVDTWQGDEHAGTRTEEVFSKLRAHHDPLYSDFSTLIRSTFDEALPKFEDGSIDLLHIDGFHTYDAVRHDFETWLPKMSDRGIVLFHDTQVRERDFGVWKFWAEVSARRRSYEYDHSYGLGVLSVGKEIPEGIRFLFDADAEEAARIRRFFAAIGGRTEAVIRSKIQAEQLDELRPYASLVNDSAIFSTYQRARRKAGRVYRRLGGGR